MVLQAGVSKRVERCFKLPLSTGTKTDEPWQVRGYSWRFTIATRKVGQGSNTWNNTA